MIADSTAFGSECSTLGNCIMSETISRRAFLRKTSAIGAAAAGLSLSFAYQNPPPQEPAQDEPAPQGQEEYRGPNVILVRFGGGVRRRETIEAPERTYCPFIYHEL